MVAGRRIYRRGVPRAGKTIIRSRNGGGEKRYRSVKQKTGKGMAVAPSSNILLHTPLLPISKTGKLPYSEGSGLPIGSLSTGALGAPNAYVFTANGMYDPNITSTGHQPMGFDQMMLFYEHYTVTKSKITVNFINTDSLNAVMVGILIAPDATVGTSSDTLLENGMYVKKLLTTPTSGGSQTGSLTCTANISKINGKKDVKSENDFRGDLTSNPVEQTYFHIFAYNPFAKTQCTGLYFEVLIEYDAIFTEPRKMIPS